MIDRVGRRHTLEGLVVDPIEGAFTGELVVEGGTIAEVRRVEGGAVEPLVFPGFIDLQVYDPVDLGSTGVTGYLLATRTVEEVRKGLQGRKQLPELVRVVTLAPELPLAQVAIELLAGVGIVAALGHTRANDLKTQAAIDAGATFATHLWNATKPPSARSPGPVLTLLLDERVTIGLIPDGRHLHPLVEDLTVRVAGPRRIALTSDRVPPPQERADGSLLGGNRAGVEVVERMARFGLAETAMMASLVPALALGLTDRGRLAPGYRADLALLAPDFAPVRTIVAGVDL